MESNNNYKSAWLCSKEILSLCYHQKTGAYHVGTTQPSQSEMNPGMVLGHENRELKIAF